MTRRLPELQERILRAAFGDRETFAREWPIIRPSIEPDELHEYDVIRLIPVLHRALVASGIDDPLEPRLRGIRRRYWYENQRYKALLGEATSTLTNQGIDVLAFKGVDLAFRYYDDPGLRPMRDLDVLVRTADAPSAIDALTAAGWKLRGRPLGRAYAESTHGKPLELEAGRQVDLHWHLREPFITPDAMHGDDAFWETSEPLGDEPQPRRLAPEDHLLLTLVGGVTSNGAHWVADAMQIVRTRPDLDWDRVVERAEAFRVAVPALAALQCIDGALGPIAPPQVVTALDAIPQPRRVVRSFRTMIADPEIQPSRVPLKYLATSWVHTSATWTRRERRRRLPQWLADRWGVKSVWHVGGPVLHRAVGKLRRTPAPAALSDAAGPQPRTRDPGTVER